MAIKKKTVSPRQKMINLMYVVLMAMLALNVSSDVLKGFQLVGDSLKRSTDNAENEISVIYANFEQMARQNPSKVKEWFDKATEVKTKSDALYKFAQELKVAIARQADGAQGNPDSLENKEDLEAAGQIMLAPARGKGKELYDRINEYRKFIVNLIPDKREAAMAAANLDTEVPKSSKSLGKNWQEYMFEAMPAIAAITMLTKLQTDIRQAESEAMRELIANIDLKDIRVNEISAYCLPEATTLFTGDEFRSRILMAAVDTTQRPEIFVNGQKINSDGTYNFRVGAPGDYTFNGYITMLNAAGDVIRREFSQKYTVIPHPKAPVIPSGATVAADLMNVLYAGFNNPISVSANGIDVDKVTLTMTGGTLTSNGNGKYVARPAAVGQDVTFNVSGVHNGTTQNMGTYTFKVRKLPDPTAYIPDGNDKFLGGRGFAKAKLMKADGIGAAIDDGLLNIPFTVLGFETTFFDKMGNAIPEKSNGSHFSERQRDMFRQLAPGKQFYITHVRAQGPDGIVRELPQAMQIIVR